MSVEFMYPNKPVRFYSLKVLDSLELRDYVVQPKWDGDRAIVYISRDKVVVNSRHRRPLSRISKELKLGLQFTHWAHRGPVILDGELLEDGKTLYIWDQAMLYGHTTLHEGLREYGVRNEWMEFGGYEHPDGLYSILCCPTYDGEQWKRCLRENENKRGFEGLVFKRRDATDLWGIYSTSERPSQLKWRTR